MERDTIFISHAAPDDNEFVRWLGEQLTLNGYTVWADVFHLKGGTPFWSLIEEVLRKRAAKVLFVVSRRSIDPARSGVRNELSVADGLRKALGDPAFIIPLRIDDTPFDELPIQIHQLNTLDFSVGRDARLASLIETLQDASVPCLASNAQEVKRDNIEHKLSPSPPPQVMEKRLAVLPFRNLTSDPSRGVLLDGMAEEIITGVARFKSLAVLARSTSFAPQAGATPGLSEPPMELEADFLVEGAARPGPAGFRLAVKLLDTAKGQQLWGGQFECSDASIFDVQDAIVRQVVSRLVSNIESSVLREQLGRHPSTFAAFDHLARGVALIRGYGPDVNEQGKDHFLKAIELDPGYGLAYAYLALADLIIGGYGASSRDALLEAHRNASRAVSLAPDEARAFRILGLVQMYLREHGSAEQHFRRSFELNPYDADTLAQLGYLLTMRGRAAEGLVWIDRAIELNPIHPTWYSFDRSMALYSAGLYREAADELLTLPSRDRLTEARLSASLAMAGEVERAATSIKSVMAGQPEDDIKAFIAKSVEFEHRADLENLMTGVQHALTLVTSP